VTLSMAGAGAVIYTFMSIYFRIQNKKRKNGEEDHLIEGLSEEEIAEKGDENPRFVYTV
jgi:hypothetical protein